MALSKTLPPIYQNHISDLQQKRLADPKTSSCMHTARFSAACLHCDKPCFNFTSLLLKLLAAALLFPSVLLDLHVPTCAANV